MTIQEELWKGEFGDSYQARNLLTQEEIDLRIPFWENLLKTIYMNCGSVPNSFLEVGAGQGPNLGAINHIFDNTIKYNNQQQIYATEINSSAREQLTTYIPNVIMVDDLSKVTNFADLVFTYGVLIHTHPAHVLPIMKDIYKASKRWIVCAEYFAPELRMIPYHGEQNALWLDDYGAKWVDNFPLRVIGYGFCWRKHTKLDNVTFWIFEKTEKMQ